jgi:tetratricopeptide (TPR) repeat protein
VGLTLAVGFTALANLLLTATFVWNEWLPPRARDIGLAALAVIWVVAWIDARADWRRLLAEWAAGEFNAATPDVGGDQWFREAQVAYLAGDWVSAEQTLLKLLRHDPRDAESRLMLATLWRHEGRHDAAIEHLDRLDCLETAAPWRDEIARERERICAASVKTLQNETAAESPLPATLDAQPSLAASTEPRGKPIAAPNRRMAA